MWFTLSYVSSFITIFESVILVSGMSTVWEDTVDCTKKYRYALDIYLMTMLSCLYGIVMDLAINVPGRVNNDVDGFNTMEKINLKGGV